MRVIPLSLAGFLVFLAFLAGVLAASFAAVPLMAIWAAFVLGAVLAALGLRWGRTALVIGIAIASLALGTFRMSMALVPDDSIAPHLGLKRTFAGQIMEPPDIKGQVARYVIKTPEITGQDLRILITARRFPEFRRGETVTVSGVVESLPQDYPEYRVSLLRRGIAAVVSFPDMALVRPQPFSFLRLLDELKVRFEKAVGLALPEPDAGFTLGILLGERASLSDDFREALNRTSTSHMIALSGFNITMIALAVSWVFGLFHLSERSRFFLASAVIVLFVILVGGGASVVLAAFMGILILVARERGRIYDVTNALVFAAVLMAFANPYILRFDLSFQLSFLATLGIILVPPLLEPYTERLPNPWKIREFLVATISAELFVYPLILWHFGTVSLVGPLANILILPVIPQTMLLGFIVGVLAMFYAPLAWVAGWALHIIVWYEFFVIKLFADFRFAAAALPKFASLAFAALPFWITARYIFARFHGLHLRHYAE